MKHKRFLSMAALLILVLSAVFLVTACPTGTTPSSGSNSGGAVTPPAVNAEETELTALLGKISLDKTIITAVTAPETITISNFPPAAAGVTAEAASNNIELIEYKAPNQLKVKALPTETADVKITVTLTKNGISKSRDFTVKVFKSGDTPTEDDYFNTLTIPTTVSDDFDLPKELQNGTPLAWSTENENIIKIENSGTNPKALIAFDIVERKVKLTATANGKSKVFEVTVLPVVKIEINNGPNTKRVYEFTQNSITIKKFRENKLLVGTLYSYTLDSANKKITVRKTSKYSPEDNKWFTIEEYYTVHMEKQLNMIKNQLESIDALLSNHTISIADTKETFKNFTGKDISEYTDQQVFDEFLKMFLNMEYNEFTALSPQEQREKIKAVLIGLKKEIAASHDLPEDSSTEDILAEAKKLYQQYAAQEIKEAKEPCTYTYSIRKDPGGNLHFETEAVYNPSKPWYENRGHWSYNHESSSPEISWISSTHASKHPNGTIEGGLSIQENHNHKIYRGTITGSGTNYTFNGSLQENSSEQITATITDNKDGTIRVKVTSGGTAESTLTFRGNPL
nr:hypothetical protein [Treponema denticola]